MINLGTIYIDWKGYTTSLIKILELFGPYDNEETQECEESNLHPDKRSNETL